MPVAQPVKNILRYKVLIKVGDHITTDHILPSGAKILSLQSNVPSISGYTFSRVDPDFVRGAKEWGGGFVVGGVNYGQGSSRDHAAMAPLYLGVKAILAKSYARIHDINLINLGIMPLNFANAFYYDTLEQGDELEIAGIYEALKADGRLIVRNLTKNITFPLTYDFSKRQVEIILSGGLLNYIKKAGV